VYSPNFLSAIAIRTGVRPSCAFLVLLLGGAAFLFGVWQISPILVLAVVAFLSLAYLVRNLEVGLYALIASGFFLGLQVDFTTGTWRTVPFISGLNAPLVEFIGLVSLFALSVAWLIRLRPFSTHLLVKKLWGFRFYGTFLLVALVSAVTVFDGITGESLRYVLRIMFFAYAAFFWFPLVIIRERYTLDVVVRIWCWVGIGIALFGLSSLFMVSQGEIIRLVPYNFLGYAPLGYNHNLLAEPLVALTPLVAAVAYHSKGRKRTVLMSGAILMAIVALLTLSRAAWLAMIVQVAVFVWCLWRTHTGKVVSDMARKVGMVGLFLVPILAYMVYFLQTSIVASSTSARYAATEVAWFYTLREPVIGYGPGTYQKLLADTYAYTVDFGEPLEAHGFLQKVLLEDGVVGLILFGLFLIAILVFLSQKERTAHPLDRPLALGFFLMVVGIIVFELFNTSYFQSVMWLPLGVAVAGAHLLRRDSSVA